jgi:Domain of unknown function (DUF4381)
VNTDPTSLDRLHDIIMPAPLPWWPPAPAWYWILGIVLVLLLALVVRFFLLWQHNRYRREALAELRRHESSLNDPARRAETLSAIAELLKRVALTAFPREQVAALTGPAWFSFLDKTGGTTDFSSGTGALLQDASYDPRKALALDDTELNHVIGLVRGWIRGHRRDPERE